MSNLHFRADGGLDMRFKASRAAVASGSFSSSSYSSGYTTPRYVAAPAPAPAPRYTYRAPAPAPRYTYKAPAPAPAPVRYTTPTVSKRATSSSNPRRKDGGLDMRHSVNKAAVQDPVMRSTLKVRKDGGVDRRFKATASLATVAKASPA